MKKLLCLFAYSFSVICAGLPYETYLESWNSNWENHLNGLPTPTGETKYHNVVIDIAFAAYVFTTSGENYGLNGTQFLGGPTDINTVISTVHNGGGKVKISYGGASYVAPWTPNYFISQTSGWPNNISTLATGVAGVVTGFGFDGVDFDIEDSLPVGTTAAEFAAQLVSFLQAVRLALPPGKLISLTIPGQGWGQYWPYLAERAAALSGLVDAFNFMEYDIWVNPVVGRLPQQIAADITTYISSPDSPVTAPNWTAGWGIPAHQINVGVMPGPDDQGHILSLTGAAAVTQTAINQGLYGVMTWDLDRDAEGIQGAAPYAYSSQIRAGLIGAPASQISTRKSNNRSCPATVQYVSQPVPPHGAPN